MSNIVIWVSSVGRHNSVVLQAHLLREALLRKGLKVEVGGPHAGSKWEMFQKLWRAPWVIWSFSTFDMWLLPMVFKRRVILIYHNITPARFFMGSEPLVALRAWAGRAQLRVLPKKWRYAAVSEFNRRELIGMRKDPVALLPCLVTSGSSEVSHFKTKRPSLLFVGRIVENKNCISLLAQVENAAIGLPIGATITIVGSGNVRRRYYREFSRAVADIQSRGHLEIDWRDGGIDNATLESLYAESWLYVSTSLHEGFGLPVCEAIARGTAAVYMECGGTESVLNGLGAISFSVAGKFSQSIRELLLSDKSRQSLLQAQRAVLESFMRPKSDETSYEVISRLTGHTA